MATLRLLNALNNFNEDISSLFNLVRIGFWGPLSSLNLERMGLGTLSSLNLVMI